MLHIFTYSECFTSYESCIQLRIESLELIYIILYSVSDQALKDKLDIK